MGVEKALELGSKQVQDPTVTHGFSYWPWGLKIHLSPGSKFMLSLYFEALQFSFEINLSFSYLIILCVYLGVPFGYVNLRIAKNSGFYLLFWEIVRTGEMRGHWLLWTCMWNNHTRTSFTP